MPDTNGVAIGALSESDAAAFAKIMQEQNAKDAVIGGVDAYSEEDAREFIKLSVLKMPQERHYAIRHNGVLVGICAIYNANIQSGRAEIGYIIDSKYRGMGYAKFAINALTKMLSIEGFKSAIAHSKKDNIQSNKALLACGFEEHYNKEKMLTFQKHLS